MMNLLARILSHGFAFAVVALIILVLMYRGEFQVWELPESLAIKGLPGTAEQAASGTLDRATDEAKQAAATAVAVPPEVPEASLAPAPTVTHETTRSDDDEAPAADAPPPAEPATTPEMAAEPAAETSEDVAESDEGSDTGGAATDSQPVEADDGPSTTAPVDAEDSTVQSTDEVSAQTTEKSPADDTADVAADEPASAAEATPASTDTVSGSDSADAVPDDLSTAPDDTTAETATTVETTATAVTEEAAPAETLPPAVGTTPAAVTEEAAPAETLPPAVEQADITPTATEEPATTADSLPATEPLTAPVNEAAPQAVVNTVSESPYEVMAKAREAYWLRDFQLAEQQYHKLTQLEPDNPDGYGEMGNMYFSQGKWEEAAAAYYQAGARLLNDGLIQQARQMVDVIRGLNGAQADDLEAQINAVAAPSP